MVEQRVPLPILISGTASFKEGGFAMSRFNVKFARSAGRGPLATEAVPSGQTHEGGTGYARDARSELFLRATASFAGEDSFYEEAAVRDGRMRELVSELATDADRFAWLQGFLPWLRDGGNMRTVPVVLAAEAVRARLAAGLEGGNRQLVGSVLRRADEPGEMLAYWTSRYGRTVPKPARPRSAGGAWRHAGHGVGKQCRGNYVALSRASSEGGRCTSLAAGYDSHRWRD
jgi:hypothetical protein